MARIGRHDFRHRICVTQANTTAIGPVGAVDTAQQGRLTGARRTAEYQAFTRSQLEGWCGKGYSLFAPAQV